MKTGYSCDTEAAVALVATTAKTILGVKGNAAFGVDLIGFSIGFDGVTASDKAVLCELCYCTWATNSPGTNSTSVTVDTDYGRAVASGMTAARAWSAEPTVLTPFRELLLSPNTTASGPLVWDLPRDRTPDSAVGEGFAIRCTAPTSGVNVRATLQFERG
jgi:hypothetical protein